MTIIWRPAFARLRASKRQCMAVVLVRIGLRHRLLTDAPALSCCSLSMMGLRLAHQRATSPSASSLPAFSPWQVRNGRVPMNAAIHFGSSLKPEKW